MANTSRNGDQRPVSAALGKIAGARHNNNNNKLTAQTSDSQACTRNILPAIVPASARSVNAANSVGATR